jgi:hypothetical protein
LRICSELADPLGLCDTISRRAGRHRPPLPVNMPGAGGTCGVTPGGPGTPDGVPGPGKVHPSGSRRGLRAVLRIIGIEYWSRRGLRARWRPSISPAPPSRTCLLIASTVGCCGNQFCTWRRLPGCGTLPGRRCGGMLLIFSVYLRRELRRRIRQAIFIALGLAPRGSRRLARINPNGGHRVAGCVARRHRQREAVHRPAGRWPVARRCARAAGPARPTS